MLIWHNFKDEESLVVVPTDVSLDRTTTTLSPGELQRLRLATQLRSGLFGVVYVLDEPSAGLHPADAEPLMEVLLQLKAAGNSLFVVEHDMAFIRQIAKQVTVLHYGKVFARGPIDDIIQDPRVAEIYLGKTHA